MSVGMNRAHVKIILIVALLARLALLAAAWDEPRRLFTADTGEFQELSYSLVETGRFERQGQPEVFRTPGYSFLITLDVPFDGRLTLALAVMQILLDVLLVYLTGLLGWILVGPRIGLVAALFQAVCVVAAVASVRLLSDSVFALLLTMSVLLLVYHVKAGRWWSLIAAAAMLGGACYVRPVGQAFAAVCVLVLVFRRPWPNRLGQAAAFAGIVLACLAPWIIRNVVVADYAGFSSFAGDSMFGFSAPKTLAAAEGMTEDDARQRLRAEERAEFAGRQPTVGQRARFRSKRARDVILSHPATYAGIHLRGTVGWFMPAATDVLEIAGLTTGARGTLTVLQDQGLAAAVRHYFKDAPWAIAVAAPLALITLVRFAGVAVCLLAMFRARMSAAGWLILLLTLTSVLLPGPANHSRFRVPVAPLLSIAAAAGWIALISALRRRKA